MSFLNAPKPFLQTNAWQHGQANSLRYNTSQAGSVVPLIFGTTRQQVNLIGFGDFRGPQGKKGKNGPLPIQGQHVGKGGGGGGKKGAGGKKSPDFSIDVDFAICQGPVDIGDKNLAWASAGVAFFQSIGLNLYTGEDGQAADPVFEGLGQVAGYSGTCHVTGTPMDLGSSPVLPNLSFEVTGFCTGLNVGGYNLDANPGNIVVEFLSNERYGAGFPSANIDPDILTTYGTYCQAVGLLVSVALQVQTEAAAWLSELTKLTNTAIVWSGNVLKFKPYGDLSVNGNGAIWTPNLVPEYSFNDDHYLPWSPHLDTSEPMVGEDDPVMVTRANPADAINWVSIEYLDRSNLYNKTLIPEFDQGTIDLYGLKTEPSIQGNCFTTQLPAATSARLILQRNVYARNTYKFQIGWQFCLLEPMDIVLLTDSNLGLAAQAVRIKSVEENENGDLSVEAEEIGTDSAEGIPPNVPGGTLLVPNVSFIARSTALTGITDSSESTFSVWINLTLFSDPSITGDYMGLFRTIPGMAGVAAHGHFMVAISLTGQIFVQFAGSNWNTEHWMGWSNPGVVTPNGLWHNVHVAVDTSGPTVTLYYDSQVIDFATVDAAGAGYDIDYSSDTGAYALTIGYPFGIQDTYIGIVQDLYFNSTVAVTDNTKFRSPAGRAVVLGDNGENPTGSSPIVFLHWNRPTSTDMNTNGGDNFGTGGDFSVSADSVSVAFSQPY